MLKNPNYSKINRSGQINNLQVPECEIIINMIYEIINWPLEDMWATDIRT